jgi:hypothetical protein
VTGSFGLLFVALIGADLYAHHKVERSAGLNRHGYRGPVVGRKQPGDIRVVMLGGSTVFGFNIEVEDTLPAQLERAVAPVEPRVPIVNLGFHQEGAESFVPTLRSYEYLDYDIVCLYEGYNDMLGDAEPNFDQKRDASPVFRTFGYFPILPLVLREKALFLRQGTRGAAKARPGEANAVFRPGLATRIRVRAAARRGRITAARLAPRCVSRSIAASRSWSLGSHVWPTVNRSAMPRNSGRWPRCSPASSAAIPGSDIPMWAMPLTCPATWPRLTGCI